MQRLAAVWRIGLRRFLHRKILRVRPHYPSHDPRQIPAQRREKADLLALKIASSMTFWGLPRKSESVNNPFLQDPVLAQKRAKASYDRRIGAGSVILLAQSQQAPVLNESTRK